MNIGFPLARNQFLLIEKIEITSQCESEDFLERIVKIFSNITSTWCDNIIMVR